MKTYQFVLRFNTVTSNHFVKDLHKKIEVFTALILSGIVFKEYEDNYITGIKELEKFTK